MSPSAGVTETVILFLGMGAAHYFLKCRRLKRDLKRVKGLNSALIDEYNLTLRDVMEAADGPHGAHRAMCPEDSGAALEAHDTDESETEDSDES